ncbi:hypothetical protein [Streptomyces sp. NPDC056244]|uniref:hypothetical protein n=1 Tax=unclassified Streptomyces TaxID=2593676 RepID=UPI0035DC3950
MSVVRRPLLTAVAAGALLCALWFVPSANATDDRSAPAQVSERTVHSLSSGESDEDSAAAESPRQLALADPGGVDATPYLFGGSAILGIVAGLVVHSVRRGNRAL